MKKFIYKKIKDKKKIKNEKGSITIFVLSTMLVVLGIMFVAYFSMMNKLSSQEEELRKIQKEYNVSDDEMKQTYNETVKIGKTDGSWSDEKGCNTPVIEDNMELVKWNEDEKIWEKDETNSEYDYVAGEGTEDNNKSKWANARVTIDGVESYFVWIPRYEYKITYNNADNISEGGTIYVRFIPLTKTVADEGYIIHPAFTDDVENGGWDSELPGIWVGKYESSLVDKKTNNNIITEKTNGNIVVDETNNTDKAIAVRPGMSTWRYCPLGNMFINAKAYSRELNSHMLKNSEWGAVVYLTDSQYGRNGTEVTINNNSNYITGSAGNSVSAEIDVGTTTEYWSKQGVLASSTGNVYGVYDLSGGTVEYVASYLYNGNFSYAGSTFTTGNSDKFSTKYDGEDINKNYIIGDATYETKGWNNDDNNFIKLATPFFNRGNNPADTSEAGIFSFSYGNGSAVNGNSTFRLCLVIK